jgi:TPR repeat protein
MLPRSGLRVGRLAAASLVAFVALVAACRPAPVSITPDAPASPTCPLEGCDDTRAARIASAHPPDACPGAGPSACGGAPARECAERALAAWSGARNEREVACVARTLVEACELGDPPACGHAGRLLLDGRGIARDAAKGVSMLTLACEGDVALACMAAIRWLAEEHNASMVPEGAALRSRLDGEYSCLTGAADECFNAGLAFFSGHPPFPRDEVRSAAEYQRGCDLGSGRSCCNLGDAYEYGNGVPRDLAIAALLYERACRTGNPLGCANLGHLVENGEGVARDAPRARELYREACAEADVYGCLHLEMMASLEAGTPRDAQRALARWQQACDHADGRACAFVGVVYEDGPDGFARDEDRSLAAMRQACKLGNQYGCDWVKGREEP